MIPQRSKDSYRKSLYIFANDVYIVCPSCSQQAIVKARSVMEPRWQDRDIKLTCTSCGYNKKLEEKASYIFGTPVDPYFRLPLWLVSSCCNNTLWAYNYEHLLFLQNHVGAKLRERTGVVTSNGSIGSRLPRWMTSSKNRETVLKNIEQLKLK